MRPINQAARDRLQILLGRRAAVSAPALAEQLGVSRATLHRMLAELTDKLVTLGQARRSRHALRRPLRGELGDMPLYAIDEAGQAHEVSQLALLSPQGSAMPLQGTGWPIPDESRDGWWDGLPYPVFDMQPQGYMGRQMAVAVQQALAVSPNPNEWGDDDVAHVLSQVGSDTSGNLILGDRAFAQWQATKLSPPDAVPGDDLERLGEHYSR